MQSKTGFPSSDQLKSYVAPKSRLKFAARCPVSGYWHCCLYMLPVAVVRSSSDNNAIRYVFPVLWMTSCLPIMGRRVRG